MITLRMPNSTGEFLYKEFDTYKVMSDFCKDSDVSPTKVYNSGRKPTDPRYCAPIAPLYFERVTKKQALVKKPIVQAVEEVMYSDVRMSEAYQHDARCCSVVSMATAINISFAAAQTVMKRAGRKHGAGAYPVQTKTGYALTGHKMEEVADWTFRDKKPTISQICREYNVGTYVLAIRGHILTIKNGIPQDWTKPTSRHRVKTVFVIKKREGTLASKRFEAILKS